MRTPQRPGRCEENAIGVRMSIPPFVGNALITDRECGASFNSRLNLQHHYSWCPLSRRMTQTTAHRSVNPDAAARFNAAIARRDRLHREARQLGIKIERENSWREVSDILSWAVQS